MRNIIRSDLVHTRKNYKKIHTFYFWEENGTFNSILSMGKIIKLELHTTDIKTEIFNLNNLHAEIK